MILGTALLYSIYCLDESSNNVPASISNRVCGAFNATGHDMSQVVKKIPVVCTGNEGKIYIDDIVTDQDLQAQDNQGTQVQRGNDRGNGSLNDRPLRDQLRALQSQLHAVKSSINDLKKKI